jgi:hypothetical protein
VRPSSEDGDPDEIAIGHFIVLDGVVQLTDENGGPLDGAKPEVLADGVNPKSIAARMTRARWSGTRGGFNRRLVYPPMTLARPPKSSPSRRAQAKGRRWSDLSRRPAEGA